MINIKQELLSRKIIISSDSVIGGSVLLEDGSFIDLHNSYLNEAFIENLYKTGIHYDLDKLVGEIIGKPGIRGLMQKEFNTIALQDATYMPEGTVPYIRFPKNKPTNEQFVSLTSWLMQLSTKDTVLAISYDGDTKVIEETIVDYADVASTISKIKALYKN